MKTGQKIRFIAPDMSIVSKPSKLKQGVFCRYGRKLKTDRLMFVWVENKGDHLLLPIGVWYLVSICESQLK